MGKITVFDCGLALALFVCFASLIGLEFQMSAINTFVHQASASRSAQMEEIMKQHGMIMQYLDRLDKRQ